MPWLKKFLLILVFALIGKIIGGYIGKSYYSDSSKGTSSVSELIQVAVDEINANAPVVFSSIRLDRAEASKNTLIYNYTVLGIAGLRMKVSDVDLLLPENFNEMVCSKMSTLIGLGVKIQYTYYDVNGDYIGSKVVSPVNCFDQFHEVTKTLLADTVKELNLTPPYANTATIKFERAEDFNTSLILNFFYQEKGADRITNSMVHKLLVDNGIVICKDFKYQLLNDIGIKIVMRDQHDNVLGTNIYSPSGCGISNS